MEARTGYFGDMLRTVAIAACVAVVPGCTTLSMPVEGLRARLGSAGMRPVVVQGPWLERLEYEANDIAVIHCFAKDGTPHELRNGPSIEARSMLANGKRRILYFDRLMLKDDTLIGHPSRIVGSMTVKIPCEQITKVEVQDGKKGYFYVTR